MWKKKKRGLLARKRKKKPLSTRRGRAPAHTEAKGGGGNVDSTTKKKARRLSGCRGEEGKKQDDGSKIGAGKSRPVSREKKNPFFSSGDDFLKKKEGALRAAVLQTVEKENPLTAKEGKKGLR